MKHILVFNKAVSMYLQSKLSISEFLKCFVVKYNVDETDLDKIYSFEIKQLNDVEEKENVVEEDKADDDENNVKLLH